MATTYTAFTTYPLEITGITSDYNSKIAAIEAFVLSDMEYSGEASELTAILPYFIYWFFLQDKVTDATAQGGENMPILKDSQPDILKQIQNWNTGVKMLRAIFGITDEKLNALTGMTMGEKIHAFVLGSGKTINEKYLSKRSIL